MRFVRITALALAVILIIGAAMAVLLVHNQDRLVALVLDRIGTRTGIGILPTSSRLAFRSHLVVVLERPKVVMGGKEIVRLERVRALISYHALVFTHGLPLYALALDRPQLAMTEGTASLSSALQPRLGAAAAQFLAGSLGRLRDVTRRLNVIEATLTEPNGKVPYVEHLNLTAFSEHRRSRSWLVNFEAAWMHAPLDGLHITGELWLNGKASQPLDMISRGRLWFWDMPLDRLGVVAGFQPRGRAQGNLAFSLRNDGHSSGTTSIELRQFELMRTGVKRPIPLGDLTFDAAYIASAERFALVEAALQQGGASLLDGDCEITQPYAANSAITVHIRGLQFAVARLKERMPLIEGLAGELPTLIDRLKSGQIFLDDVTFESTKDKLQWTTAAVSRDLQVMARLGQVGLSLPAEFQLPPLDHLEAALNYNHRLLTVSQASGRLGRSSIKGLNISARLSSDAKDISYKLRLRGDLDVGELYPAVAQLSKALGEKLRERIERIDGRARLELSAEGRMVARALTPPDTYAASIEPYGVSLAIKSAPTGLKLVGGNVIIRPGLMTLDRMMIVSSDGVTGSATLSGDLELGGDSLRLRDVVADLHQLHAEQWLPLLLNPKELAVHGPVGGKLLINSDTSADHGLRTSGKLTMGPGQIRFAFLRSPMIVQSASLTLDGQGVALAIPAAKLENEPLDFKLSVSDLLHPVLRIDASVAKLDLEAMKFVRVPWSPKTESHFFAIPVTGHIEAREANLEKLPLSNVKTDFTYDRGNWRVHNFSADCFRGKADLELSGRAADDWINIKGRIAGMDAGPLFLLSGAHQRSPLLGKLYADADIWADSNVDFFKTMEGKISLDARDGTLEKFTLLSRILSLIDLKSWLTAQIPDPRIVGVPFTSLTADFSGQHGAFYTNNLKLQGPVMDIVARGTVQVGEGTLNMEVGLIPFNTVNWLVNKIPLVGQNIAAGSNELLAAYFQVRGPVGDPRVTPKPITSVAEFVAKTLSLPINILLPSTAK
jgi:AsmA-like C-terminal region